MTYFLNKLQRIGYFVLLFFKLGGVMPMQTFLSLVLFMESSMLQMSKILVGLSITSVVAFANPTTELGEQGISKTDSEFLFKNNSANVVALSSDEMKATEGEWIHVAIWAGYRVYQNRALISRAWRVGYTYQTFTSNWR